MAMPCRNRAEGKGNTAEVEFVLQMDNEIVPVEVKSENNFKAKSLSIYRKTYSPSLSLRFSTRNIRKDDDLLNLPLYRMFFLEYYFRFSLVFCCSNNVLRLCSYNNVHIII